jgi:hypothetical protein
MQRKKYGVAMLVIITVTLFSQGCIHQDYESFNRYEYSNEIIYTEFNSWADRANDTMNRSYMDINTKDITHEEYLNIVGAINNAEVINSHVKMPFRDSPPETPLSAVEFKLKTTIFGAFYTKQMLNTGTVGGSGDTILTGGYWSKEESMLQISTTDLPDMGNGVLTDEMALGNMYNIGWHEKYKMVQVKYDERTYTFTCALDEINQKLLDKGFTEDQITNIEKVAPYSYKVTIKKTRTYIIGKVNGIKSMPVRKVK